MRGRKISNRLSFTLIAFSIVLFTGAIVFATTPSPGHSSVEVEVQIEGVDYTLQEAINQNLLGGGSGLWSSNDPDGISYISGNVGIGMEPTSTEDLVIAGAAQVQGNLEVEGFLTAAQGLDVSGDISSLLPLVQCPPRSINVANVNLGEVNSITYNTCTRHYDPDGGYFYVT